jgi:uncharacterized protein (DUF4415 family)
MGKIDLKEITAKAKDKPNKAKSSIYLDQDVYKSFKAKCKKEGVKVSKVLEAFMVEYSK